MEIANASDSISVILKWIAIPVQYHPDKINLVNRHIVYKKLKNLKGDRHL